MRNTKTAELVLTALFAAIIIIMAFTPLGYIPLVVINATIIHIPVILGALFCGPKKGGFLGFIFGLTSFIKNTVMPSSLSAFVFSPVLAASMVGTSGIFKSAFICFVPRILVGILPYYVYLGVRKAVTSENKKVWSTVLNVLIGLFLIVGCRAFINKVFAETVGSRCCCNQCDRRCCCIRSVGSVYTEEKRQRICIHLCGRGRCDDQHNSCYGRNLCIIQGCLRQCTQH